jgi:DnaK suppressor protein
MKSIPTPATAPGSARREELRRALEARRRELEVSVRGQLSALRAEHATVDHVTTLDDGGISDIDTQEDIALALVQMKLETLERIDAALEHVDAGQYGRCVECGDDIAAARLRALPFAVRCVGCEGARETKTGRRRHLERGHDALAEVSVRLR